MKALITGADGFIGSHLTEKLLNAGYETRAFVYYNSFNTWGWLDTLPNDMVKEIEIVPGDIRDSYGVKNAVKGVDIVFHLAALIAIPFSYIAPSSYVETNINGTLNILQASRELNVSRILVTSTSEVYGTAQYIPIDEKHPLQPQSPYSASKIGADAISDSFFRSFDLPVTIVRPFNTYGPRQSARAFIPTLITQLLSGREQIMLGNLEATRDFNYVKDTANGFIKIAQSETTIGEIVNIASNKEFTTKRIAEEMIKQINPNARIVIDSARIRPKNSEVERLWGDDAKIKRLTGWRPEYTFEQGLFETIEWFKINIDRYKSDIYNV